MIIIPMPIQAPPAQIIALSDNEFKNTIEEGMLCIEERTEEHQYSKLMPLEDKPIYSDFPSIINNHA